MPIDWSRLTTRRWQTALLIFGSAVIPFAVEPFRLENHETQRLGLLAIVAVMIVLTGRSWRQLAQRDSRPLVWSMALWVAAVALASLLSLSPTRSLFGDLIRRMGLFSQLALMAAFLLGSRFDVERDWRWFWRAGLVTAVYLLLEVAGALWQTTTTGRPPGPFGSATFSGEWLSLVCVWVGVSVVTVSFRRRRNRAAVAATGVLLAAALLATGSRGALMSVVVGGLTAVLTLILIYRSRWLAILLIAATVLALMAGVIVGASAARSGRLSRFTVDAMRGAFAFRTSLWTDIQQITHNWPQLPTVQGGVDARSSLRPFVGYGPEMFEAPDRLYITPLTGTFALGQRLDRAHNVWLDDTVTLGLLGLVAQIAVWASAWWVGLRRAGIAPIWIVIAPALGLLLGYRVALGTPFLPLICTLGALLGLWLLLIGRRLTQRATPAAFDVRTVIALSVLTTHIFALQFSFITAATEWPTWLALGLLLSGRQTAAPAASADRDSVNVWSWVAVAGMFLLRFLLAWSAQPAAIAVLLVAALIVGRVGARPSARLMTIVASVWILGAVGAFVQAPALAALWDIASVVIAFAVLTASESESDWGRVRIAWPGLAAVAVVLFLFGRDIAADIQLQNTVHPPLDTLVVETALAAQQLRPWDDRTVATAAKAVLDGALAGPGDQRLAGFQLAEGLFLRVAALNPVEPDYALELAIVEANLALPNRDAAHIQAAQSYFDRAIRLWPGEAVIWRERGRFALTVLNDPEQAKADLNHALDIDPYDNETYRLLDPLNGIANDHP